ncbi:MAG TPA: hypothetical protein DCG47_06815 [Spirochaetaceae bacterium]|jgi:hypothetical protein|nr:hypothetical protein [Spirochaetaceae bacterium]
MVLGTSKAISSIALALVPPGNILASINELRRELFGRLQAAQARAYFDFPVLAWLAKAPHGADIASLASSLQEPLRFKSMELYRGAWFLGFDEDFLAALSMLDLGLFDSAFPEGQADGTAIEAPFAAGRGLYLAPETAIGPERAAEARALADEQLKRGDFNASTYLIAAIELVRYQGEGGGSSWATLASARAGEKRGKAGAIA